MQIRLGEPTDDINELFQAILKIYGEQKSLPDLQVEIYAIKQSSKENVDDYFYEKIAQHQQEEGRRLAEETVRDRFISQLFDDVIQKLLDDKFTDSPNLWMLVASDYVTIWASVMTIRFSVW